MRKFPYLIAAALCAMGLNSVPPLEIETTLGSDGVTTTITEKAGASPQGSNQQKNSKHKVKTPMVAYENLKYGSYGTYFSNPCIPPHVYGLWLLRSGKNKYNAIRNKHWAKA